MASYKMGPIVTRNTSVFLDSDFCGRNLSCDSRLNLYGSSFRQTNPRLLENKPYMAEACLYKTYLARSVSSPTLESFTQSQIASCLQGSLRQCLDCGLSLSVEQSYCLQRDTTKTMQVFEILVFQKTILVLRLSVWTVAPVGGCCPCQM